MLAAVALFASGIGLWATDSGPFRDSYCWGAWQERSGPGLLSGEHMGEGEKVTATESAPPSASGEPAECEVTVTWKRPGKADVSSQVVSVSYGRLPEEEQEHRAWLARFLPATMTPLPEGLDGTVAKNRAMYVMPAGCDVKGRPTVVTVHGNDRDIGRESEVARLLVDVAETAMRSAGCAPREPLDRTLPMATLASGDEERSGGKDMCRIPGVRFDLGGVKYTEFAAVFGDRLQVCTSRIARRHADGRDPGLHLVMTGSPRLSALFAGLPEGADKGLVQRTCDGRKTTFYMRPELLKGRGVPDDRTVFGNFVRSVSERMGCGKDEGNAR
ncbi:hypothetical protein I3F58_11470 [Streptomyces sp. MUM 203J]|uniref:hypothetical protein n=1 Tax=Streptomyces sp. MUM 203J TaxID=2791990 RepID=UPI001F04D5A9|nr:hypothetical protein [Streptomyces sp. MUM 203J]MCH0540178.1 hypothetical protein [Streptomyces sp. MUM 203J]